MDANQDSPQILVIPFLKPRLLFMIVGSLVFMAAGSVFVIGAIHDHETLKVRIEAALFSLFIWILFGRILIFAILALVRNKPAIILTADGFTDNSSITAAGAISWEEVDYVSVARVSRQWNLTVALHDNDGFMRRQPLLRRAMIYANRAKPTAPISIASNLLPISIKQLEDEFDTRLFASRKAADGQN